MGLKTKLFEVPLLVGAGSSCMVLTAAGSSICVGIVLFANGMRAPVGVRAYGLKIVVEKPLKLLVFTICCWASVGIVFVTVVG